MSTIPELMSLRQVSERLRVPETTLRTWRHRGHGPASFKIGAAVVYHRADVDAFASQREEEAESA
jgi:hypothetical protein